MKRLVVVIVLSFLGLFFIAQAQIGDLPRSKPLSSSTRKMFLLTLAVSTFGHRAAVVGRTAWTARNGHLLVH